MEPKASGFSTGQKVIARWTEDQVWYRAVIIEGHNTDKGNIGAIIAHYDVGYYTIGLISVFDEGLKVANT